ncbi:MAG: TlyA family RNA methyltransferase [Clostridium sp.]|nr:TlyA family RNA methyltransferase [Clostridium sp.]
MKERLDKILISQGHAASREQAKAIIMSGNVFVNGQREDKSGTLFDEEQITLVVQHKPIPYVSRGGLKLEKALRVFEICVDGLICMDIGASTGGFTDCMLQNGAAKVYSIDVGYGQLDWKLRQDCRVCCIEKMNFRYFQEADFRRYASPKEWIDFASADVSFISLEKILPPAYALLREAATMLCLIKPQFEAGREKVGKKGVVKDPLVHEEAILRVIQFAQNCNFVFRGLDYSPIRGPKGNIEYLLYLQKSHMNSSLESKLQKIVSQVVNVSHQADFT